ncbi:diaminopimelate epimerase [Mobilibacterium timonense]|uniref:diaminopimelate epimerase n=1 Tax=Mobilibacterium timonense TaxID=1871012 RepID=UPI002FE5C98B
MRASHRNIRFTKLHSCGDDYIIIKNFDGRIEGPESLCVSLCDRKRSVGGNGIVLIEKSRVADVRMRVFNRDGSEAGTYDNGIRCGAKYIYEEGFVGRDRITVETVDGVRNLRLFLRDGRVNSVSIECAEVSFAADDVPVVTRKKKLLDSLVNVGGREYRATCLSVGNPHCVLFLDQIDNLDLEKLGTEFEYSELFPDRINTEFVRIVDRSTMRMRVWERSNGETLSCGSAAIAAAAAAVELGYCDGDKDISVEFPGGDMLVSCQDGKYTLTGEVMFSFEGKFEY